MLLTLSPSQFEIKNTLFSEKVENKVINNSDFYRIIYSDDISILSGINIYFNLNNISIEKYFNKIKCCILDNSNVTVIDLLKNIENDILDKLEIPIKNKILNIASQFNNEYIKIYTSKYVSYGKKTTLGLLLKISGIWESTDEYGLTFRFFIY